MPTDRKTQRAIEVRVDDIAQLFDMLDPFPFRERDLDKDAEEYIVGWAQEFPRRSELRLVIHAPEKELQSEQASQLEPALRHYFSYRAEVLGRDLNELFRVGRLSLVIGLTALGACVLIARTATVALGSGNLSRFIEEGLIILGWVANWKPIQIFLYDWWPLARRRDLYRRLAAATVELRSTSSLENPLFTTGLAIGPGEDALPG
jgi:hypothetical protein